MHTSPINSFEWYKWLCDLDRDLCAKNSYSELCCHQAESYKLFQKHVLVYFDIELTFYKEDKSVNIHKYAVWEVCIWQWNV